MPTRRVLRSVLCNFLGTYTSRYSDYGGYWLFGFLTRELESAEFDLLAEIERSSELLDAAHELAVREFKDQLVKSGLDPSNVIDARLHIERLSEVNHAVGGTHTGGWNYRFLASATADTGRTFKCETVILVAPHDPRVELRSGRASAFSWPFRRRRVQGALDE